MTSQLDFCKESGHSRMPIPSSAGCCVLTRICKSVRSSLLPAKEGTSLLVMNISQGKWAIPITVMIDATTKVGILEFLLNVEVGHEFPFNSTSVQKFHTSS